MSHVPLSVPRMPSPTPGSPWPVVGGAAALGVGDGVPVGPGVPDRRGPLPPLPGSGGVAPPGGALEPDRHGAVLSTAGLARIALDTAPTAGEEAPAALLGPWWPTLSMAHPPHRRAMQAAVAASAWTVHPGGDRTPLRSALRDKRQPGDPMRRSLLTLLEVPHAPWRIVAVGPEGWTVEPLVSLSVAMYPNGPVDPEATGWVDAPPAPGALWWARMVPEGPEGAVRWRARCGVVLPEVPSEEVLGTWLGTLWAGLDGADRWPPSVLLRVAGHGALAVAHRWWWAARAAPLSSLRGR